MTSLRPEKRMDVTGKLVTRHVRDDAAQPSKRLNMPAPALGGNPPAKPAAARFKPRASQLRSTYQYVSVDKVLPSNVMMNPKVRPRDTYEFQANAIQMYDVLSVVENRDDAVVMLADGVRTADEARAYLRERNSDYLIVDRSDLMQEAIEKNVNPMDFMMCWDYSNEWGYQVDAILFAKSALNKGANSEILQEIVTGDISYDDIKALGPGRLKSYDRLFQLRRLLRKVKTGEESLEGVDQLLTRSMEKDPSSSLLPYLEDVADHHGCERVNKISNLMFVSDIYSYYTFPYSRASKYGDTRMDRIMYLAEMLEGSGHDIAEYDLADQMFDAGIPVEVAALALSKGGGLHEALAIHEGGINANLADGWL